MTTYNTGNPLGSAAAKDLYDNAQNFDFALNDITQAIWNDRFGRERNTWFGLETMVINAAGSYGYVILNDMSFQDGGTVNLNELLLDESTGEYFKWTGTFPVGGKVVPPGSTPASTGGEGPGAWLSVGDSTLRTMLASSLGAGMVGYDSGETYAPGTVGEAIGPYTATGGDNKYSKEDRARWKMSALEFSTPLTDIADSVNKALDSVESEANPSASVNTRGGTVHLTRGVYPAVSTININRGSSGVSSKSIKGDGQSTTELNFAGAPALSDGIAGNDTGPAYGEISNLKVKSAPRRAFSFAKYSRMTFDNIQAESSGADGFYGGIGFVCNLNKITAAMNAANGVRFDPALQHTSHVLNGGYASNNNASGWLHGWMNYSVANGLAADNNALYGHLIEKCSGYILNGCGAESNGRSGFAAIAAATVGETVATTINNAFSYANNAGNSGYANLLHVTSTDNAKCIIRLQDSISYPSGAGSATKDIIVDGNGAIVKSRGNITPNGVETRNGGYIIHDQETCYVPSIPVTSGTAKAICNVGSTQGHRVRYGGEVTIMASNQPPSTPERNTTLYKLLVNKSIGGGSQVLELGKLGHVSGGGASLPSFTWTLVGDQLIATPMTGVGGTNFWFEIDCVGQIVAYAL
ncbi:hypothetical protein [Citrobacter farmeri]|uniref:tail fiber/spike domain-containing protein n=1 Tax=Citrobacter farmeri TaxID=67824 RepID=UPI0018AC06FE|nr:hypothetical protein [Citrobacter farmeri]MDB2181957.1 hypothetical protein [Citrobacter farmeri]